MEPTSDRTTENKPKRPKSPAENIPRKRDEAPRRRRQQATGAPENQQALAREEREQARPERHRRPPTSTTAETPARRAKRSKKTKTGAGVTGVFDPGSDLSEPIAAHLTAARDLASLATTSKQMHEKFGNVLGRLLWRAVGKPEKTGDCGDTACAEISPASHKAYFTALRKYELQNFSYVHDVWLKKNRQVRAAYKQYAKDNRLGRSMPPPTPQNLYYVLNRMFPLMRLSTETSIGVQRATLAALADHGKFDKSPLREAVAEFLKLNPDMNVKSVDDLADLGDRRRSLELDSPDPPEPKTKDDWHWSGAGKRFERQLGSKCPWLWLAGDDWTITQPLGDARKDAKSGDLRRTTAQVLADLLTTDQASVLAFLKNDKHGVVKLAKLRQCVRDAIDTKYAHDKKLRTKLKKLIPK